MIKKRQNSVKQIMSCVY